MAQINPHVNFNGNAEEAFLFYQSVFGGTFQDIMRFKDIASAEFPIPEEDANKIMHISLPIGNSFLMANDVPEFMGRVNENENRSKIFIHAESQEEAKKLYEQIITEYPNSEWAHSARGAMQFLGKSDAEIIKELKKKAGK